LWRRRKFGEGKVDIEAAGQAMKLLVWLDAVRVSERLLQVTEEVERSSS